MAVEEILKKVPIINSIEAPPKKKPLPPPKITHSFPAFPPRPPSNTKPVPPPSFTPTFRAPYPPPPSLSPSPEAKSTPGSFPFSNSQVASFGEQKKVFFFFRSLWTNCAPELPSTYTSNRAADTTTKLAYQYPPGQHSSESPGRWLGSSESVSTTREFPATLG